jgi:EpsI family protein
VTLILTVVGVRFREDFTPPVPRDDRRSPWSTGRVLAVGVAAVALAAVAPVYVAWGDRASETIAITDIPAPDMPGWTAVPPDIAFRPEFPRPHAELMQGYRRGDVQVDLFVGYFAQQSTARKLPRNLIGLGDESQWRRAAAGTFRVDVAGEPLTVAAERIIGRPGERRIWAFYWVNGRFTASLLQAKIEELKGELLGGRRDAAVIVLSAPLQGDQARTDQVLASFAADIDRLRATLAGLGPTPAAKAGAGR